MAKQTVAPLEAEVVVEDTEGNPEVAALKRRIERLKEADRETERYQLAQLEDALEAAEKRALRD